MQLAFKIQGTESFPTAHLLAINQGGKTTAQLRGKKKRCCDHCEEKATRKTSHVLLYKGKRKGKVKNSKANKKNPSITTEGKERSRK